MTSPRKMPFCAFLASIAYEPHRKPFLQLPVYTYFERKVILLFLSELQCETLRLLRSSICILLLSVFKP